MPKEAYELLALGARYWFAFLGVLIVWRSFSWLRKDAKIRRKRLRQLPDAGLVGEFVVLAGSDELPPGTVISIPREGTLGSLRSCDVSIPCSGVAPRHGDFHFENGVGLILTPAPRLSFTVDGEEPDPQQREWLMHHGSRLVVGDAVLRMRLFMGLETSRPAALRPDEPVYAPYPDQVPHAAAVQGDWQEDEQDLEPENFEIPPQRGYPEDLESNWEGETRPYRRMLQSFPETGRQAPIRRNEEIWVDQPDGNMDPEWEEPLSAGQPFYHREEPTEDAAWYGESYPPAEEEELEEPPQISPPPRRGFFGRRR